MDVLVAVLVLVGALAIAGYFVWLADENTRLKEELARRDDPAAAVQAIHDVGEAARREVSRVAAELEQAVQRAVVGDGRRRSKR